MANIFPEWTNRLPLKVVVCGLVFCGVTTAGVAYYFTPKFTRVGYQPGQPAAFSHALHVGQIGMDCRFCHAFVEVASHADMPSTQVCMSCHTQITPDSPKLEAVRESWKSGRPLDWVRVNQVPDYAYFNHAAHVRRGVTCQSCHGPVPNMEALYQDQPQSMAWCLDCHRAPENHLRPPGAVFDIRWAPGSGAADFMAGQKVRRTQESAPPLSCGACHR